MDIDELREALKNSRRIVASARHVLYCYEMQLEKAVQDLDMIKNKTEVFLSDLVTQLTEPDAFLV